MKHIFIAITCVICLFIISQCKLANEDNELPIVNLEVNLHNMQKILLSEFTDKIKYVVLDSIDDYPLAWIKSIGFSDDYILVSDDKSCFLYDNKGQFIKKIGRNGRGPGEYVFLTNVFLENDKIYIRDLYNLIEFNLDGTFINKFSNTFKINDIYLEPGTFMINDTMIIGHIDNRTGQTEYKALIINKQGDVKFSFKNYILFTLEPGVRYAKEPGEVFIHKYKNNIFYKELLNDTLFQIDEDYLLIPKFIFNFGKYKLPIAERGKQWTSIDFDSYIFLYHIFQTDEYLILDCEFNQYFPASRLTPELKRRPGSNNNTQLYNTKSVLGIYNRRTNDLVFSEPTSTDNYLFTSGLYNDIDGGPRFFPDQQVNDSTLVMFVNAGDFKDHINSDDFKKSIPKYPEKKKELERLANSLKETDNPVLMLVRLKK